MHNQPTLLANPATQRAAQDVEEHALDRARSLHQMIFDVALAQPAAHGGQEVLDLGFIGGARRRDRRTGGPGPL